MANSDFHLAPEQAQEPVDAPVAKKFNEEQQALIDAPLTTKVVGVAGAGTGKTTTILARTQRILKEFPNGRIVLITFTRMAANDMRVRLLRLVDPDDMRRIVVGTFHSVVGQILRENAVAVGLQPSFSVIDENSTDVMYRSVAETNDTYREVIETFMLGPKDNLFDEKHDKLLKKDYHKVSMAISAMVNTAYPTELLDGDFGAETKMRLAKMYDTPVETLDDILPTYYNIFKDSLSVSRETNTVNYDHILFLGYLMGVNGMLKPFADSIVHMIVDEYQDTNLLQDAFVRMVGGDHLTIVGDIDQAIYEFRGGKAELLDEHAKESTIVNLTLNYRSYQPILDAANNVIEHNVTGSTIRKPLRAFRQRDEDYGGMLLVKSYGDKDESNAIIEKINYLTKTKGVDPSEIAILVRSRMSIASINMALQKNKIAVNDTTRFADFMKSDVMRDTLNFVKIFTNPKDIYAFMAVLDRPKRGLGPKAIQKIQEAAAEQTMSVVEYLMSDHINDLTPGMRKKIQSFVDVYNTLIEPEHQAMTLPAMIEFLLDKTGYMNWIHELKNKETHLRNVEILHGMVADFTDEYAKTHRDFTLFDIANAFTFDMTSSIRQEDKEGVTIATIHGAKGLEWEHVFVIGLEQENFPGNKVKDDADLESERRLMYVAITRAKNSLWLTESKHRITYGDNDLTPSVFIDEMGEIPERQLDGQTSTSW